VGGWEWLLLLLLLPLLLSSWRSSTAQHIVDILLAVRGASAHIRIRIAAALMQPLQRLLLLLVEVLLLLVELLL